MIYVIGYPTKKTKPNGNKRNTFGSSGRGMSLEKDLNNSNDYYLDMNRAVIHKKPTPIQVVRVDYPNRSSAKIVEAYYKTPSTTDYNGIYRGRYIDFEAKETRSKTSFPFRSIHPHQIEHLKRIIEEGGIGFFIIRFSVYEETYLIDASILIDRFLNEKRQSITYEDVVNQGSLIRNGFTPCLHYLDNVDAMYFSDSIQKEVAYEKQRKQKPKE